MMLYKYRPNNENTINLVKDGIFWFAKATSLNDPFECDFAFGDSFLRGIDSHPSVSEGAKTDTNSEIASTARSLTRRRFHILSLSAKWNDIVMWSHYSKDHTGVVVQLSLPETLGTKNKFLKNNRSKIIHPVEYNDKPIILNRSSKKEFVQILTQKSEQWAYEQEYRIIIDDEKAGGPGLPHKFGKSSIKAVTFGVNTSMKEVDDFIAKANRNDIVYKKAIMIHGHFKLSSIPV